MTKNLDFEGLKSIAENYDLFYIDLWGVMHNGVKLHEGAIFTLKKIVENNKNFVLLTNAPRPIQPVKEFLETNCFSYLEIVNAVSIWSPYL